MAKNEGQAYKRGYRDARNGTPFRQPYTPGYLADQYAAGYHAGAAKQTELARKRFNAKKRGLI